MARTWTVRERSGNLKIHVNGYSRETSENLFILFKRGKDVLSHESLSPSPISLGATLKGKNLLPWDANSFL